MIQTMFLSVFIFSFYKFYAISVTSPCQPKRYTKVMTDNNALQDGEELECLPNLGFDMCVNICERTTNCSFIEHNVDTLLCCLIKAESLPLGITNSTSALHNTMIEVLTVNEATKSVKRSCPEAATCTPLKSGGNACVDLIDHIGYCSTNRYLVTGKYGVQKDRVSFSTVRNQYPEDYWYQLDSLHGWTPASMDQHQWIQVLFYRRRFVTGIVTRGFAKAEYNSYVSEYRLEFLSMSYTWRSVLNDSGNVKIFPGNINWDTAKINYLPRPLRAAGIRLRPVSWINHLILRFDILGC